MPTWQVIMAVLLLTYWSSATAYTYRCCREENGFMGAMPLLPALLTAISIGPILLPIMFGTLTLMTLLDIEPSIGIY